MIKKKKNNDYLLSDSNHWVRDLTKPMVKGVDINNLIPIEDMKIMLENETKNHGRLYQRVDTEDFSHQKIVIISDGYKYDQTLKILKDLPKDVIVIGVNGVVNHWNTERRMNYYVVNNPYEECMNYLDNYRASKCIASTRTHHDFVKNCPGIYIYSPVTDEVYSGINTEASIFIDDYRNPICAAISLAYMFKVKKLMLLSLLDLYDRERPGTEKVNDLWIYPQQKMSHSLIDANLYWLQKAKIDVVYNDAGPDYKYSTYINQDMIGRFFK